MSRISEGMSDGAGDVQVDANPCGGIYALEGLVGGIADIMGNPIPSTYVARTMRGVLVGEPRTDGDACATGAIANPDNVAYLPGHELLVVAEDTDRHTFPTLWAYDTRTWEGSRLATAPPCAEWTGIHWFPEIEGSGWLTVSLQHAYAYGSCAAPEGTRPEGEPSTWTGVFGPFPPLR